MAPNTTHCTGMPFDVMSKLTTTSPCAKVHSSHPAGPPHLPNNHRSHSLTLYLFARFSAATMPLTNDGTHFGCGAPLRRHNPSACRGSPPPIRHILTHGLCNCWASLRPRCWRELRRWQGSSSGASKWYRGRRRGRPWAGHRHSSPHCTVCSRHDCPWKCLQHCVQCHIWRDLNEGCRFGGLRAMARLGREASCPPSKALHTSQSPANGTAVALALGTHGIVSSDACVSMCAP